MGSGGKDFTENSLEGMGDPPHCGEVIMSKLSLLSRSSESFYCHVHKTIHLVID